MLSKKMAFSLMSLITLLALAFAVPSVMAAVPFEVKLELDSANVNGRDADFTITFAKVVSLAAVQAETITIIVEQDNFTSAAYELTGDKKVKTNGIDFGPVKQKDIDPSTTGDQFDGKTFTFTIPKQVLPRAKEAEESSATRIHVSMAAGIPTLDPNDTGVDSLGEAAALTINLRTTPETERKLPKVVSVQRLRPGSQTVVAAFQEERIPADPFNVRIVLTGLPHLGLSGRLPVTAGELVKVENGTASNLFVGTPFAAVGDTDNSGQPIAGRTTQPHPIEGKYNHDGVKTPAFGDNESLYAPLEGVEEGVDEVKAPLPTSPDGVYSQYRVTITPYQKSKDFDVKIRVRSFHDNGAPVRNTYLPPGFGESVHLPNGRDILTIPVLSAPRNLEAGYRVVLPKDIVIPGGGYLVITQNSAGSEVVVPSGSPAAPDATERTPAQLLYNVHEAENLPNLATAFPNGVVVDVESYNHPLLITEVMWGEDTSLNPSSKSQYIELYNPAEAYITIDDRDETSWRNEAVTLVFYASNEFEDIPLGEGFIQGFLVDESGQVLVETPAWWGEAWIERPDKLPRFVSDRIGTLDVEGTYWSPFGIGSSGRSGSTEGELTTGRGAFEPSVPIVSMYRVMDDAGKVEDGQMKASWADSERPKSANFDPGAIGIRYGTPGAATEATRTPADDAADAADAAAKAAKAAAADAAAQKTLDNTGTIPEDGRVYISEVMFAGGGTLPQWIEISNGSRREQVNLSDWTITVKNTDDDVDVDVGSIEFTIPKGTTIDASGQHDTPSTILVVTEAGRTNVDDGPGDMGEEQILNLWTKNQTELILEGITSRRYSLLSDIAFKITLAPPAPTATKLAATATAAEKADAKAADAQDILAYKTATDVVGNLGEDWALPLLMGEDARSSIVRGHFIVSTGPAEPKGGTMKESWALASDTHFGDPVHFLVRSHYGDASDKGTPGFRSGGALPVELSHFRPARDKVTGTVAITWSTQSELNNAGFFIKRSQQKDGEFQIINATMIQGAGTTSEKQFYTYTDTTAQPNVVYYYQIEDVSLDGNHQTLTRGIRLKGHIGAAGKLTTLWGELKTSNE